MRSMATVDLGRAAALVVALALGPSAAGAEPVLENTDVFVSGADGYFAYRIPAIETAPNGTLLAFAEARKYNLDDPGGSKQDIDLVLKRSTDQGKTWSAMVVIEDPGEFWSAANPATVVDRQTGRVWVHYLRCKPGRGTYEARPGTDDAQNLVRFSDDNGASWSEPIDLTAAARDMNDPQWHITVVGPGGGLQTRSGRLIAPAWRFAPWSVFALLSDDHGKTWQRGQFVPKASADENQMVELADGRVLVDMRQHGGPHRLLATSADGGATWSEPRPGLPIAPVCCAIERWTLRSAGDDRDRILWTGPKGPGRTNLVARLSYDEGQSFPLEKPLSGQYAAYSDLTVLSDKTVGVLWERGESQGYQFITFTRLRLPFVEQSP